jgi:hypothetical protein
MMQQQQQMCDQGIQGLQIQNHSVESSSTA